MRALAATDRTRVAIRKADALPTVIPGGKMRKGALPTKAGGGSSLIIAKVLSRSSARTYSVDLFSRWEADYTVSNTYRTAEAQVMKTPGLDDTATADQLAAGRILLVTVSDVGGTAVYVPSYPVGLL